MASTGITNILREHYGWPAVPKGAYTALIAALPDSQRTGPSRWVGRGTRPDPSVWPIIEEVLGLEPGTLAAADRDDDLRQQVADLVRQVSEISDTLDQLLAAQPPRPAPRRAGTGR